MENSFYTKENHDLKIMDLVNLGIVVLISLKNTIIFFLVFFLLIGFLSTSNIEPQYNSQSRLLIELPNINLKDEQNIDFSSLNAQAIQTEIEKIKSNAEEILKEYEVKMSTATKEANDIINFAKIKADTILENIKKDQEKKLSDALEASRIKINQQEIKSRSQIELSTIEIIKLITSKFIDTLPSDNEIKKELN